MPRQDVSRGPLIPEPSSREKRDRKWEKEQRESPGLRTVTYRKQNPVVCNGIRDEAARLYVTADDMARFIMEAGWELYQEGKIKPAPVLEKGRLTLYPKSE